MSCSSKIQSYLPTSIFSSALHALLASADFLLQARSMFSVSEDSVLFDSSFDILSKQDSTVNCFMMSVDRPSSPSERVIKPSKKAVQAPLIMNDIKIYALLDCGSELSIIDKKLVQSMNLPVYRQNGTIKLATVGHTQDRHGYVLVSIRIGDKTFDNVKLEVLNLNDSSLLIGLDHWSLFGFRIEGIPCRFPEDGIPDQKPSVGDLEEGTDPDSFVQSQWHDSDRLPPDDVKIVMDGIATALKENGQLTGHQRCTHPAAVIPLDTGDHAPVYRSQYNVPQALEHVVTDKVNDWFQRGIIARAPHSSSWNSPLLVVRKRDPLGNYTKHRVCIDPRAINQLIPDLSLAVPKIAELFRKLHGFEVASSLDLQESYHQFPIREEDRIKTTFTWMGVRYFFVGAPFGFKPITQLFQSCMEQILEPCMTYVIIFVDDILVFSFSISDHILHLNSVINLLTSNFLRLNIDKCHFAFKRLKVLGHIVSGKDRIVDPKKLSALKSMPIPQTGKQVSAMLGFVNYLRDYIPNYAMIAAPLEKLRKVKRIGSRWDDDCQKALEMFRNVLSSAPVLEYPKDGVEFKVATDASQFGVGAALYQFYDERNHYISFVSTSLSKSQRNYSATRRELLAIIFALKRFYYYLYGTHFELHTDHNSLTYLFTQKHSNYMMLQWFDTLVSFTFTVVYCPGITHILPDVLSRLYAPDPSSNLEPVVSRVGGNDGSHISHLISKFPISSSQFSFALSSYHSDKFNLYDSSKRNNNNANIYDKLDDEEVLSCLKVTITELVKYPDNVLRKYVDERLGKECPSESKRLELLEQQHAAGHFGAEATYRKLWDAGYYWPRMHADCTHVVSQCDEGVRYNVAREGFHLMQSVFAKYPFEHIAIDLMIMNPVSERGHSVVLVVVCIATRYVLLEALMDKTALTIARALLVRVICVFGPPKICQSDNGPEFVNKIVRALNQLMGVIHGKAAPYNPRANGAAERFVGTAKKALYKMCGKDKRNFDVYLPLLQYAMNIKPSALTGCAPATLVLAKPVVPFSDYAEVESKLLSEQDRAKMIQRIISLVYPELWERVKKSQAKTRARTDKRRRVIKKIPIGSSVMLVDQTRSSKADPKYIGPYTVVAEEKGGTYRLLDSSQQMLQRKVPSSQLKIISSRDEETEVFIVEKILKHRGSPGSREYLVKWQGYPHSANTWEPARGFEDQYVINAYWEAEAAGKAKAAKKKKKT